MKPTSLNAFAITLFLLVFPLSASALSNEKAKEVIEPFYEFLSNPLSDTHLNTAKQNFHPSWKSYYSNSGYKTLTETMESITYFGKLIPDLNWEIQDVIVSGNIVTVRGEASGTPKGDFFGVPHTGKNFTIMSIDIHKIEEGKVLESYHIEDWAGAIKQLSGE